MIMIYINFKQGNVKRNINPDVLSCKTITEGIFRMCNSVSDYHSICNF